ncbi:MAG: C-terminal binding protein [Chloroflexi bacterium OHK40]
MPTVCIPDPVETLAPYDEERAAAESCGAELIFGDGTTPLRDADVLLTVGLIPIDATAIAGLERCRLIVRYGIGVDTIDVAAATARGIVVANAPTYCVEEVSDHAAALALGLARRVVALDRAVRERGWAVAQGDLAGVRRMRSRTLGVVGMGRIGAATVRKLHPFVGRTLGYDPFLAPATIEERGADPADLETLLRESDIVSLHVPLSEHTRGLIGADALALMRPTALLVNTSRGPIVDEAALARALSAGRLAGAALDVVSSEPLPTDSPLLAVDQRRLILTPHAAASSDDSLADLRREVFDAMRAVLAGRWPGAVVNPDVVPRVPLARA